ncbi:MAG TPA: hypothetical protein VM029_21505, partial [Opitutaceae bacterium]|nr:hypothetical protein [Opitutaceae bacterium]
MTTLAVDRRIRWVALATLVIATGLAYARTFSAPFVFDDIGSIANNASIRSLWPPWTALSPPPQMTVSGRPLLNLSFALNYAISGTNPWSYHAVNLAIHVGAGLLLFGIVRRTLLLPQFAARTRASAMFIAWSIAALWLLHPLQTESVTYIVQRAESLAALSYLLTLYAFVRAVATPTEFHVLRE